MPQLNQFLERSIHKITYAALLFVAALVLDLSRVFAQIEIIEVA